MIEPREKIDLAEALARQATSYVRRVNYVEGLRAGIAEAERQYDVPKDDDRRVLLREQEHQLGITMGAIIATLRELGAL